MKKSRTKKTVKKTVRKKTVKKTKTKATFHSRCPNCLVEFESGVEHDCVPITERELFASLDEDLRDAFFALKATASAFGEQRIYNNARAVMFSRRVCYMFVRPKKSYLELCFFLPRKEADTGIHRVDAVSKTKFSHIVKVVHSDQVEAPLTDWLQEAFEVSG